MILAVETTKPRDAREPLDSAEPSAPEEKSPERISREELYEDIKDAARCFGNHRRAPECGPTTPEVAAYVKR
ncbi:MAG: hypothetical protein ACM338_15035 [Betaproteobacteria bacterium]